jgi:3-deoxy-D-manno-octulosonic-acid transferase
MVPVGGHNILEASLLRLPVLFGPYMQNFKDIATLVLSSGGGFQVDTESDLKRRVEQLLLDPLLGREMGAHGHQLLAEHAGATARTLDVIEGVWER